MKDFTKLYSINRNGSFKGVMKGEKHCAYGEDGVELDFHYDCTVWANGVDEKGFVIDNLDIKNIVECEEVWLSCEEYAEDVAMKLLAKLKRDRMYDKIVKIDVTFGGTKLAYARFILERNKSQF